MKVFSQKRAAKESEVKAKEKYGMFVFAEQNLYAHGIVDFHGLNGYYPHTWTVPNGGNWFATDGFLFTQLEAMLSFSISLNTYCLVALVW